MTATNPAVTIFSQTRSKEPSMNGKLSHHFPKEQQDYSTRGRKVGKQQRLIEMICPISGNLRVFNSKEQTEKTPPSRPTVTNLQKKLNQFIATCFRGWVDIKYYDISCSGPEVYRRKTIALRCEQGAGLTRLITSSSFRLVSSDGCSVKMLLVLQPGTGWKRISQGAKQSLQKWAGWFLKYCHRHLV